MKIIEKNCGKYITYSLNGTDLSIGDGKILLDLAAEQRGEDRIIDICADKNGELVIGIGDWYIAQIYIPKKKFEIRENGIADAMGFRQITKTRLPIDMDEVVLTLWAMEEK